MPVTASPQQRWIRTRDGVRLSLRHFPCASSKLPPVLLTHGTFSNGSICARLAAYLASEGFDPWVFRVSH